MEARKCTLQLHKIVKRNSFRLLDAALIHIGAVGFKSHPWFHLPTLQMEPYRPALNGMNSVLRWCLCDVGVYMSRCERAA
jgi:hypothetical protein